MLRRVQRLFAAEMTKVWRTKFPYLGIMASALMALIARQSMEAMSQPGRITAPDYLTASVNMATTLVVPIFAAIFGAMLVASEASRGAFRTILTRPVTRAEFLSAKLLSGLAYLFLLIGANIAVALLIASSYPLKVPFDPNITVPGLPQQIPIFAVGLLLSAVPQIATVCFAFFVSVLASNGSTAVGVAVGLLLSIQPAKHYVRFGSFELEPWVFSSYYDTAMRIAGSKAAGMYEVWNQPDIYWLLATSGATSAVLVLIAYRVFLRRDLNL